MLEIAPANERKHLFMAETATEKLVEVLSRRDFLKLIAGAGLGFGIAMTGLDRISLHNNKTDSNGRTNRSNSLFREAYALPGPGSWETASQLGSAFNTTITAIHVAMLKTGNILILAGSSFYKPPPPNWHNDWLLYNPANGNKGQTQFTTYDPFCSHQVQLPDGKIFFAGGTLLYDEDLASCNGQFRGIKQTYIYNPDVGTNGTMTLGPNMREARWYPTMINLPDGRVACFSGDDEFGNPSENRLVQIYDPTIGSIGEWVNPPHGGGPGTPTSYTPHTENDACEGDPYGGSGQTYTPTSPEGGPWSLAPILGNYPRMHLMPSGLIFKVGMNGDVRAWNPTNALISPLAQYAWGNYAATGSSRSYGNSFLLPLENETTEKGRILICGGGGSNTAQLLTFTGNTSFSTTSLPNLNFGRKYSSQIILPDGTCMIFGGTNGGSTQVYQPEAIHPDNLSAGWDDSPPLATVPRVYHSTALLLPDGRVWNASGTPNSGNVNTNERRVEIYNPWYMNPASSRPTITGDPIVSSIYGSQGGTITITTPDAQQLDLIRPASGKPNTVSLVRLNAVTHHYEPNMRLVWLKILSSNSNSVVVNMPLNANLAPPGYYTIHVLKNGRPSAGKIIKIPGDTVSNPDQTTPTLTITSPSAAQVFSGPASGFTIQVAGGAADNTTNGVASVQVTGPNGQPATNIQNVSGNWSSWTATVNTGSSSPGTLTRTIIATTTDTAGNTSSVTIPITIVFS